MNQEFLAGAHAHDVVFESHKNVDGKSCSMVSASEAPVGLWIAAPTLRTKIITPPTAERSGGAFLDTRFIHQALAVTMIG